MSQLTLEVPPDVSEALCLPEQEARPRLLLELALGLYTRNLLPLGKASRLAGVNQHLFSQQLGAKGMG
jgi:predicted HTH domain antitoxin